MAFNAGSIEATLDVDRNPFTRGLKAARAEARAWARDAIEIQIKPQLSQTALARIQQQLNRVVGRATISPRLDQERMRAVKAQIERQVGRITVRPQLDQTAMRALRERINRSVGSILVKTRLDWDSFRLLQQRIRNSNAYISVKTRLDRDALMELRARLRALNATAHVNVNVDRNALASLSRQLADADGGFRRISRSAQQFGNHAHGAFSRADGAMRLFIGGMPLILPALGAAVTGAIGLVGALTSAFVVVGAAVGAFGLVVAPVFKEATEGVGKHGAALNNLKKTYDGLVASTKNNVGLALAAGFDAASAAIRPLTPLINETARVLTRIGQEIKTAFETDTFKNFVGFLTANVDPVLTSVWDIIRNLVVAVGNLTIAFMPMAQWLLRAIADGMADFAKWTGTLANDPKFQAWVELAKDSLEKFWYMLENVIKFMFNLSAALTPIGTAVFDFLGRLFEGLSRIPPEWLQAISMGLSAIFTALLFGGSPQVALVVGVVTALATGFDDLYKASEPLRGMIDRIWQDIQTRFIPIFRDLWQELKTNVMPVLEDLKKTFEEKLLPALEDLYFALAPVFEFLLKVFGEEVIGTIRNGIMVISGLIETLGGVFKIIAGVITLDWDLMWEGLKQTAEGALNTILGLFGVKLDDVIAYFQNDFVPDMQATWDTFWNNLKTGWEATFGPSVSAIWEQFLKNLNTVLGLEAGTIELKWNEFWTKVKEFATTTWDEIKRLWAEFWTGPGSIGSVFEGETPGIVTQWNTFWDDLKKKSDEFNTTVLESWHGFWAGLLDGLGLNGDEVVNGWKAKWDQMGIDANLKWEELKVSWGLFWEFFSLKLDEGGGLLSEAWDTLWAEVGRLASEAWESLKLGWSNFWINFIDEQTRARIDEFINTHWTPFWDNVKLKATEIWEQLKTGWAEFWGVQQATQDTGQATSEESWGEYFRRLGENIGNWIRETQNSWVEFWGGIRTEQDGRQTEVEGSWNTFWGGLSESATRWWGDIQTGWSNMLGDLVTTATRIWGDIQRAFDDGVAGVRSAINGMIDGVNGVFGFFGIAGIPRMESGGTLMPPGVQGFAAGGELYDRVAGGFKTNGPKAIVGEGNPSYPEYVIPTDPKYRSRAVGLYNKLGSDIDMMASGGILGTGLPSLNFPSLPSLDSVLSAMTGRASGPWLGIAQGVARKIWSAVVAKVEAAIQAALAAIAAAISSVVGGGGGGPIVASGDVMAQVQSVANAFGWGGGGEWAALMRIIQKESGWNPNAANPTSSARGLFQKMTSIHGPVEGSAGGQASWGLNYIRSRYGSPSAALAFHNRNGWYDEGGWLPPGLTTVVNNTNKPEAVLNEKQWKAVMAGKGTPPIAFDQSPKSDESAKIASSLDDIKELLERRGTGATINMHGVGGSAAENAQAVRLALRLS